MTFRGGEMAMNKARIGLWAFGGLLALLGIWLAIGGAWLASLGGSFYYLIAGVAMIFSGGFIALERKTGAWIYLAVLIGKVAWAFMEVGFDILQLLPRVACFVLLGLYMLTPWVRRTLQ
jgi:glucose dehydrogenase